MFNSVERDGILNCKLKNVLAFVNLNTLDPLISIGWFKLEQCLNLPMNNFGLQKEMEKDSWPVGHALQYLGVSRTSSEHTPRHIYAAQRRMERSR